MTKRLARLQKIVLFAVLLAAAATPATVFAGVCCRCKHPQVINGNFCVTTDDASCANLKNSANADLKMADCEEEKASARCAKIPQGVCLNTPSGVLSFRLAPLLAAAASQAASSSNDNSNFKPLLIDLNVSLPGLQFDEAYMKDNQVVIPYLAQYVAAVQKIAMGLGLVAAAIMIVWGGFKYIMAGTGAAVKDGKNTVIDALIGLVLLMASYLILANVNPNVAATKSLTLPFVQRQNWETVNQQEYAAAAAASDGAPQQIPTPKEVTDYAAAKAKELDLDPCILYAIIMVESGGKALIGHDEDQDFSSVNMLIDARLNFMRSRKFFSGKTFDLDVPTMPPEGGCIGANRSFCLSVAAIKIKNDDKPFNPSAPPDYGLDWRFSHGIGFSQATIFSKSPLCGGGGRGYTIGGKCFTVPQLVTKEGAVASILAHPALKPKVDPETVFCAYGGKKKENCASIKNLTDIKMRYYGNCPYKPPKS